MVYEYEIDLLKVKRIHNVRDFAYKVESNIPLIDLALYLNSLTDEAFFWAENNILHSTGEVDWLNLLPEEIKKEIKEIEKVKEGYLEQSKLGQYTAFVFFVADGNRILVSNFKANPVFKKLRKRTKEGWNLSLWLKFLHDLGLGYKYKEENIEYQIWRWFSTIPEGDILNITTFGGISVNKPLSEIFDNLTPEVLKKYFRFRIKGTYRIGKILEINPENGEATITFDGIDGSSTVPLDRLFPIFLPHLVGKSWNDKDRSGLLKHLRLTPKVKCKYFPVLIEVLNRLLEPYMVKVEPHQPRWEKVNYSTNVVVDKPIKANRWEDIVSYIFEERKVYNAPFDKVSIAFVDLYLKSEKNKKLLKDSKRDFIENLKLFFGDLNIKTEIKEFIFNRKIKVWDKKALNDVVKYLRHIKEELQEADFSLVLIPEPEFITQFIKQLPLLENLKELLKDINFKFITDREIKTFYKTQKVETKRKLLFGYIKEIFKTKGGTLFILDEPLPYGKVAIKTNKGYEIYNLFGEFLGIEREFKPSDEEILIIFNSEDAGKLGTIFLNKEYTPIVVKREYESGVCYNSEEGIIFQISPRRGYLVLRRNYNFGFSSASKIEVGEDLNLNEAAKTVLELKKIVDF
jgi:hypothetical protein